MAAQWYIVQAYSNFEKRVKETLERVAEDKGLAHLFEEILVPTETVVEVRRGRKVESERKFFPGYVLVKVDLTDAAYHLIANAPKVTGFLGASGAAKRSRRSRRWRATKRSPASCPARSSPSYGPNWPAE